VTIPCMWIAVELLQQSPTHLYVLSLCVRLIDPLNENGYLDFKTQYFQLCRLETALGHYGGATCAANSANACAEQTGKSCDTSSILSWKSDIDGINVQLLKT
jgi:hypothetical protein